MARERFFFLSQWYGFHFVVFLLSKLQYTAAKFTEKPAKTPPYSQASSQVRKRYLSKSAASPSCPTEGFISRNQQIWGAAVWQHFHRGQPPNSCWKWKAGCLVKAQSRLFIPGAWLPLPASLALWLHRALSLKLVTIFVFLTVFPRNLLLREFRFSPVNTYVGCRGSGITLDFCFLLSCPFFSLWRLAIFPVLDSSDTLKVWLGWISSTWLLPVFLFRH